MKKAVSKSILFIGLIGLSLGLSSYGYYADRYLVTIYTNFDAIGFSCPDQQVMDPATLTCDWRTDWQKGDMEYDVFSVQGTTSSNSTSSWELNGAGRATNNEFGAGISKARNRGFSLNMNGATATVFNCVKSNQKHCNLYAERIVIDMEF